MRREEKKLILHLKKLKELGDKVPNWNYKYYGKYDNISELQNLLAGLTKEDWSFYDWRQTEHGPHKATETIPILFDPKYGTHRGKESKFYPLFKEELTKLSLVLPRAEIIRAVLVKLPKGEEVKAHWDYGNESFREHPRIHMAVQTNQHVNFNIGGEEKNMKLGEFWEINNFVKKHGVKNLGDTDRIHLIVDIKQLPVSLL
jgi:hypothetical protein